MLLFDFMYKYSNKLKIKTQIFRLKIKIKIYYAQLGASDPFPKQPLMSLVSVTMNDEITLSVWSRPQVYEESQGDVPDL